jgi:hypothetical protein
MFRENQKHVSKYERQVWKTLEIEFMLHKQQIKIKTKREGL